MAQTEAKINMDTVIAQMVVEQGLATTVEVDKCRKALKKASEGTDLKQKSLVAVLISNGVVTKRQVERLKPLIEEQKSDRQIPGFQIIKKLGAGAMATVYLARQLSLDRMVAIKILPQKYMSNEQFVERFYAEGRAAAKLNHANIVGALDVGKAGDYHYFVMEYVEGRTVYDDIIEKSKFTEENALNVILQTATALEHAHKAGFIHRDVKPKNIMITSESEVKLADMGLARAVSDREAAEQEQGKAFGTPYYISPEQIRGEIDVDFRADIYSLGATFYHMVTGQVPFDGANPSAVMHKHLKSELVAPDHINPDLSSGIGEVIEVCMAKDRNKRYNNTTDLLEDLQAMARGEPPMQAREKFDLSTLSALEEGGTHVASAANAQVIKPPVIIIAKPSLAEQPLFWVAFVGWLIALIILILWIAL